MDNQRRRAARVVAQAPSNADGLIHILERDDFPGQTARERLRWVLRVTASIVPGMQMELFPPDDSGFREEFGDLRFYRSGLFWADFSDGRPAATKQMGHFLTALGLRLKPWPEALKLMLITGHEKLGDGLVLGYLRQFLASRARDRRDFLTAVGYDRIGAAAQRDELLRSILGFDGEAIRNRRRIGNSLPDLRLSVKGWRLGDALLSGEVQTRAQASGWIKREIYDPSRRRA